MIERIGKWCFRRRRFVLIAWIVLHVAGVNLEFGVAASTIASVLVLGIVLFVHPGVGVVALSWWLGFYALLFGIALLSAAFRIRYHPI